MKNRYRGKCHSCEADVLPEMGTLVKHKRPRFIVICGECIDENEAVEISKGNETSYGVVTSTGWVGFRNRNGRCEDAPCCGCCTF